MAVRFEEKRLIIVIDCYNSMDYWVDLQRSLYDIIRNVRSENIIDDTFYAAIDFLSDLLPDPDELAKDIFNV